MSTHTEYTVRICVTQEDDRYLSYEGAVVTAEPDLVGLTRPVIVSEREVEDPEPEHPTARIIRITAVSDRVNDRFVGRIGLRSPLSHAYYADLGGARWWINERDILGWEDVTPVPTRLVANYAATKGGLRGLAALNLAEAAEKALAGGEPR